MIKGCQRKIILLNGSESSLFESAYFVLKKNAESGKASHTDMVREANRIIERSLPENILRINRRKKARSILCGAAVFLCGALFGGGAFWSLCALLGFPT